MRSEVLRWLDSIEYIDELNEYLKIPSVSRDAGEVRRAALHIKGVMERIGMSVEIVETSGNPAVIATIGGGGKSSVLFYGHYDVQPPGDRTKWNTDPFDPVVNGSKLWGRGSADNKGQHYAHILAIRFLKNFHPEILDNVEVKVILDGDEERGSFSMREVLEKKKELLASDLVYISDGPSLVSDSPTVVGSVRGILAFQITISHGNDLHSGNYGGVGRSAVRDAVDLISSMVDPEGISRVDGFYDQVESPADIEHQSLELLEPIYKEIMKNIVPAPHADGKDNKYLNQLWPTMNVNGMQAGGVDSERRTIIPGTCKVSMDCRLVPSMTSERTKKVITSHVQKWGESRGIDVHIEFEAAMEPMRTSLNSDKLPVITRALEKGFGSPPVIVPRLGGSLPTYLFPEVLESDSFLVPYALPDENNHAPNENLDLDYFKSGVAATASLIAELSRESKRPR